MSNEKPQHHYVLTDGRMVEHSGGKSPGNSGFFVDKGCHVEATYENPLTVARAARWMATAEAELENAKQHSALCRTLLKAALAAEETP